MIRFQVALTDAVRPTTFKPRKTTDIILAASPGTKTNPTGNQYVFDGTLMSSPAFFFALQACFRDCSSSLNSWISSSTSLNSFEFAIRLAMIPRAMELLTACRKV